MFSVSLRYTFQIPILGLQTSRTKAAHSGGMSQVNQTAMTNRWLVYWQFLQEVLFSVNVSPLSFLLSPHTSFTLCFSHKLTHTNLKAVSLIFRSEILKCSKPNGLRCHEWKRLLFCFSPTHLNTCFSNSLSSLSLLCGLVRQLCSVGRVSESDLTSAVLLLSWLVCLTLIASGCESYVKYGAITFFPSSADHCEIRRVCVCVSECVWRHVLRVRREEMETDYIHIAHWTI